MSEIPSRAPACVAPVYETHVTPHPAGSSGRVGGDRRSVMWTVLGLVLSAVFLWLALRGIDLKTLGRVLLIPNYWWVTAGVAANLANLWLRAVRWRILLRPIKPLPNGDVFSATMIGFMANNLLPARIGELSKVYVLAEEHRFSKTSAIATVVAERWVDMVILLLLTLLVLAAGWPQEKVWISAAAVAAGACLVCALVFLGLRRARRRIVAVCERWLGPWPAKVLMAFVDGLEFLAAAEVRRVLAPVFLLSAAIWLLMLANVYVVILAFRLPVPASSAVVVLVVQSLGVLIPSGPGQLGTFQFLTVASLGLFAVDQTTAFGLSLVHQATRVVPTTIVGLYFLARWFARRSASVASP